MTTRMPYLYKKQESMYFALCPERRYTEALYKEQLMAKNHQKSEYFKRIYHFKIDLPILTIFIEVNCGDEATTNLMPL